MKNNIIDVIENHEVILKLFDKAYMVRNEIKDINKKNKVKEMIIETIVIVSIFLTCFLLLKNIYPIAIVVLMSLIPSLLTLLVWDSVKNLVNEMKKVNKNMIHKSYKIDKELIINKAVINDIIIDFENSLNNEELKFYKNHNYILYNCDNNKHFLYNIYLDTLRAIDIDLFIKNKDLITNRIERIFNITEQKKLFNIIADVIEENNTNKEMKRINESLEKFNNINVENINVENI